MKRKQTTKTKKSLRAKKYNQVFYLGLALAIVLILEGILIGATTKADWENGAAVLDISSSTSETLHDTGLVFQPMLDLVYDVHTFYELAATEMAKILDLSQSDFGSELAMVYDGVEQFYNQASDQMAMVLDLSSMPPLAGNVAGISIQR